MRIVLVNIRKSYNSRLVLDIGSLTFENGKIYAILGQNGSGKTTMLRLIAGIDKPDCGDILFGDKENGTTDISYLSQNPYIFDFTVIQNVMLGMGNKPDTASSAEEALNYVGMKGFAGTGARSLSGGEGQRIAVARTLVLEKSLVLLDEPAAFVDASSIHLIENYIKASNRKNDSTIIFNTHNPSQALRIADEVILLHEGKVIEKGEPEFVLRKKC